MNYELAKQLKSAGFPQNVDRAVSLTIGNDDGGNELVDYPTLEELIDACGNDFGCLILDLKEWEAFDSEYNINLDGIIETSEGMPSSCVGKTPTEAVAKLWLELNK